MTDAELIERARNGNVIGNGYKQIELLVSEVASLRHAIELSAVQYQGCGGRLSPQEVADAMRRILDEEIARYTQADEPIRPAAPPPAKQDGFCQDCGEHYGFHFPCRCGKHL